MRLTVPSRVLAVSCALLACLSGAGSAMAHGWAHAEEHHGERALHDGRQHGSGHHQASTPESGARWLTDDDNDGHHGHADVGVAVRVRSDVPSAAEVPARIVVLPARAEIAPIAVPRAFRVRGDPSSGPPPPLRSPPSA